MPIEPKSGNSSSNTGLVERAQQAAEESAQTQTGNQVVDGSLTVVGKFGCNGKSAVSVSSKYTLTYSTEARTVPAATAANVVTTKPALASYGFTEAQAEAILTAINAGQADTLAVKKLVVALIKDLEAVGICG